MLSLLEADASAPLFLDGVATGSSGFGLQLHFDARDITDLSGQEVDRYRLVRLLGSGGMGAVYLARRSGIRTRPWPLLALSTAAIISSPLPTWPAWRASSWSAARRIRPWL